MSSRHLRLLCWPMAGQRLWLHHVVAPRAEVGTPVTLVSQLRDRASNWALQQWHAVEQAESGMKYYLKRATAALLRHVSDEEVVLRAIPADSRACVILHPPAVYGPDVAEHIFRLAKEHRQFHRKWCFASWAALGITIPLMLLPILPALPAYWNFFRIWSNRKAWLGAAALDEMTMHYPTDVRRCAPCTRTLAITAGQCCRVEAALKAAPSGQSVLVACDLLAAPYSAADEADEAAFAQVAADVERALEAPGLAAHAQKRLLAARKLRRGYGQL